MRPSPLPSLELARSGGPAPDQRPAAPSLEERIAAEVAEVARLDLHELRIRWRKLFRSPAPPHLSRALLMRIIAYRIQANAFGDLNRETVRLLDRIGRQHQAGEKVSVPPVDDTPTLKPGTELVREHGGVLHKVTVVSGGYAWAGTTYRSLSEVARIITGTSWNGPRFFGLRDRPRRRKIGGVA